MFREPPNPLSFDRIVKNTIFANENIIEINVNELDELKSKTEGLPGDSLLGIIIKASLSEGHITAELYMITLIKKDFLDHVLKVIEVDNPSVMDFLEAINNLPNEYKPLANFVMGYQETSINEQDKIKLSSADKVLGIENRFVNETLRNKGLMKQMSYNILEALYHLHGDFMVTSQPVHIATLKFYATLDMEKESLSKNAGKVKKDGYLKEGVSYGVITTKPALALLRHHSPMCNSGLQSHWKKTTSPFMTSFEEMIEEAVKHNNDKDLSRAPK